VFVKSGPIAKHWQKKKAVKLKKALYMTLLHRTHRGMLVISWLPTCTIQPAGIAVTYDYELLALTPRRRSAMSGQSLDFKKIAFGLIRRTFPTTT
jgi:hypothetical protein